MQNSGLGALHFYALFEGIKFQNSEFLNYRTVWAGQTFVSDLILILQNVVSQKCGQHIPTTEDRFAKRNQSVIIEGFAGKHSSYSLGDIVNQSQA
jgi:hypothetical protein